MCRRSKRLVAAWYQPGGALNKTGTGPVAPGTSNVVPPGGQQQPMMTAASPAPMYYVQQPQPGTPISYMSPQPTGGVFMPQQSPAPVYYAPPPAPSQSGVSAPSDRDVSPGMAHATPISPAGSSPNVYNTQPAPVTSPTRPKSGAHEMG